MPAVLSSPYARSLMPDQNDVQGISKLVEDRPPRKGADILRSIVRRVSWVMDQGESKANLGSMPLGEVDAAAFSSPYLAERIEGGGDEDSGLRMPDGSYVRGSDGWEAGRPWAPGMGRMKPSWAI